MVYGIQSVIGAHNAPRTVGDRPPVCLITPPSAFLLDERVFVSLGILKVAAALEARGYAVNFLDLSGIENYLSALADYLAASRDVALGITTTTPQLPSVMKIAVEIRARRPDLKLVLGRPHVTLIYSALKIECKRGVSGGRAARAVAKLEAAFDVLCSGDGELAIFAALADDAPKVIDGDDPGAASSSPVHSSPNCRSRRAIWSICDPVGIRSKAMLPPVASLNSGARAAMRRAGFRWLLCGFEAANPRILVNIEKRAGRDNNDRCIEIAKAHDLKVKALMSVGHPGESAESIGDIRNWLIRMQVDDFDCTVITIYPGTPYYDLAVPHPDQAGVWTYTQSRTGDRLHAYDVDYTTTADYYKGDPNGGYRAFVFTDHLSAERIVTLRDQVEREVRATLNIRSIRVRRHCATSTRWG